MLLKEDVENALFCQSAFSIKHYIMSMMMILFSDHRYNVALVILKKLKLISKPSIVKLLHMQPNLTLISEKFKKILRG
jgi:hypothetical protein